MIAWSDSTTNRRYRWAQSISSLILAFICMDVLAQETLATPSTQQLGEIQVEASRVYVLVEKTGLGHRHGVEAKLLASTLILGAEHNAGKLVFDMTSFDADTPLARKHLGLSGTTDDATRTAVNENMRGAAILDVANYPTATFDVTSAKATGETSKQGRPTYRLVGKFTLHGTTKPLEIRVEVEQERGWLRVHGGFAINQTSFGISPYSKAFGAIGVADQLKIFGDLFVAPTDHLSIADIPAKQ